MYIFIESDPYRIVFKTLYGMGHFQKKYTCILTDGVKFIVNWVNLEVMGQHR